MLRYVLRTPTERTLFLVAHKNARSIVLVKIAFEKICVLGVVVSSLETKPFDVAFQ